MSTVTASPPCQRPGRGHDYLRRRIERFQPGATDSMTSDQCSRCEEVLSDLATAHPIELENEVHVLEMRMATAAIDPDGAVLVEHLRPQLVAGRHVLREREWITRNGIGVSRESKATTDLRQVCRGVRESISIGAVLRRSLPHLKIIPGRSVSHCPCPHCGGTDRFILHDEPLPSWGYCRQCTWSPDVVGIAAYIWGVEPRGRGFRETVLRLANEYGVGGVA